MARYRYNYKDIKIGDIVTTTAGESGEVVAIKSYAYLNDKIIRKSTSDKVLIDLMPFQNDNVRHLGVWYSALTIAIKDKNAKPTTYYLVGIDFTDIKEITRNNEIVKPTLIDKIKKLFKL